MRGWLRKQVTFASHLAGPYLDRVLKLVDSESARCLRGCFGSWQEAINGAEARRRWAEERDMWEIAECMRFDLPLVASRATPANTRLAGGIAS